MDLESDAGTTKPLFIDNSDGDMLARADRELVEELRRFARSETFDEQLMSERDSEPLGACASIRSSFCTTSATNCSTLRPAVASTGRPRPYIPNVRRTPLLPS
jgi:hypothetical protein